MRNILTIAKRELTRLRSRFGGGTRPVFLLVMVAALGLGVFTSRQTFVVGEGMYRVAVSADAPQIHDPRFNIITATLATGRALLDAHAVDAVIDGTRIVIRGDDKSRYAAGALKRVLEKSELGRIYDTFELANAFPLRIEVNYLTPPSDDPNAAPPALIELVPAPTPAAPNAPPGNTSGDTSTARANTTDDQVRQQISNPDNALAQIQSGTDKQIIIPSLTTPPNPFGQVILAFLYILPVFFVSVFFTSGFMDEKLNRRLTILLSAPITPLQIILGKMLPYVMLSLAGVVGIAIATQVNALLALAIFAPAVLFIFGIYLMVPMLYRSFKDTTFISMLATSLTTAYLIFPAMFSGISDLAYMSPVTLAVKMYRSETFGISEYLFATTPLVLIFALSLYIGTRVLNEEYLMGYRSLTRKLADAIFLIMNRAHLAVSIFTLSLLLIPIVYVAQLIALAISLNLPMRFAIGVILIIAATIEEIAKSAGIVVLHERGFIHSTRQTFGLAFLSALGFLLGEKALLLVSLGVVSQSNLSGALFNSGLLPVPLAAHFIFTSIVSVLTIRFKVRYPLALLIGIAVHSAYNLILVGGAG